MKKGLLLSITCSTFVLGAGFIHPLPNSSRSTENGGTLSAIDAYQDGVGAMVVQEGRGIDNSAMNKLVFKYGNTAKDNTLSIGDQVILTGTPEDKLLAGKLFADGVTCNDGNNDSTGETYLNGICQGGVIPDGASCSDNNVMTVNDIYTNQICSGTLTVNGTNCTHTDPKVINEIWNNGVCQGTLTVNGTTCIHTDSKVINETWLDGVCQGTLTVNGQSCDDANALTVGDQYNNGVCSGTYVTTCKAIKTAVPSSASGSYFIDPDGVGGATGFNIYCDMTTDGGGWTLVRKIQGNITVSGGTSSNNISILSNLNLGNASLSDTIWNQLAPTKVFNICNKRQTVYTRNINVPWYSNHGIVNTCGYNTGFWTGFQTSFSSPMITSMSNQACGGAYSGDWGVLSGIYANDTAHTGCYDGSENTIGTGIAPAQYTLDSGVSGWAGHGYVLVR